MRVNNVVVAVGTAASSCSTVQDAIYLVISTSMHLGDKYHFFTTHSSYPMPS